MIQVLDPVTGNCLTWRDYGQPSDLNFAPCVRAPDTLAQLFYAQTAVDAEYPGASVYLVGPSNDWEFVVGRTGTVGVVETGSEGDGTVVDATYRATVEN